jgi:uncharacterized lipoprotein NlpE involved in copper resistance
MKKLSVILLAATLSFISCHKTNKQPSGKQSGTVSEQGVQAEHINGVYKGTLPCADCPGIKTTLKFKQGNNVEKTTLYLESNDTTTTTKGTYKVDKDDSTIIVMLPDQKKEFYRMKADTAIVRLNADKEEITGPLAKAYVLTKKSK